MWKFPESFPSRNDGNLRLMLDPGGEHDEQSMLKQFYNSLPLFFDEGR